jgi:hypothetical protein
MSTTYANPATTTLTEVLPRDFTWAEKLDRAAVLSVADAREWSEGSLVPAPYADPRMADIARYAVMIDGELIGRVVQGGPRSWGAYSADASHHFGNLRTKEQAAAYILLSVER